MVINRRADHPLAMLTELYIEALLVDAEAADAVWNAWDAGVILDELAALAWWSIVVRANRRSQTSR